MTDAAQLAGRLPADIVSFDEPDLQLHALDMSPVALIARRRGFVRGPDAVVRPRSTAEVSEVLRAAQAEGVPVVPWGGGSGVCNGIAPEGGIVLDLRGLKRVLEVDETSLTVTVEAGISGPELVQALADKGYTLGHEPQSLGISTVGGWIATRASGQLSAGYGGIEDLLVGLVAVLPDGRVATTRTSPRRSTGPEVADLMIGSEGTLGVVAQATLRIRPLGAARANTCCAFETMAVGIEAVRRLAQSDLKPLLARLYDPDDTALFWRNQTEPPVGAVLLLSFEGTLALERADLAAEVMSDGTSLPDEVIDYWWAHRNDAVDDYAQVMAGDGILGPHALVDTMEISALWTAIPRCYRALKDGLSEVADIATCHLSHAYADGACLYFVLASACSDDDAALATHERWWDVGMTRALEAGASISHHHGVGRLKAGWLPQETGAWWSVLKSIKDQLDPKGIMNPGALGL